MLILANGLSLAIGLTARRGDPARGSVSRSRAGIHHASLIAEAGRIGIDIETLDRVAANATASDDWLAPAERALARNAASPVLELACHWVLKEAYGKALGVGLALPLADLSFVGIGGDVVLEGAAAPSRCEGWRFSLHRLETLVVGIAHRADRQIMTPLAPLGRNPPTAPLER